MNFNAIKFILCIGLLSLLASCGSARYAARPEKPPAEGKLVVASWYGSDFHGKPTSSGEIFNMYAKTCAHKEYPFGTRLKVTNTANDKSTECTVNDRGPFISGRDLDLSYACAREIGLVATGTGTVRIDYLGRGTGYAKEVKYSSAITQGPFTIQVGSFKEPLNATRLKLSLEFKYSRVYVIDSEIDGSVYYRVRIGKFNTKEDAHSVAKSLAEEGYSVLITSYNERI